LALVGTLTVTACGDDVGPSAASTSTSPTTAPASTTSAPPVTEPPTTTGLPSATDDPDALPAIQSASDAPGVVVIEASPFPDWVTVAGDSAWVANVDDGVARYDHSTGELLGSVPTGTNICLAMDVAFDSLWVGDCGSTTLLRVGLTSGAIEATIALPLSSITEESSVAAGPDGVFVLGDRGTKIVHIEPADNSVTSTFAAPAAASALRTDAGALWATSSATSLLTRLDPSSGAELATVDVGAGARFFAIGEGSVWVMNNDEGTVSRVDPSSNSVVATIVVSDGPIGGGDMAVGGGYAWARVSDALVSQIDAATNVVVARYGLPSGSGSVAADDDAVWISAHDVHRVWRIPIV